MSTTTAVLRRSVRRSALPSAVAIACALLAGCYESHVVWNAPLPDANDDAGGPSPDAGSPRSDAGVDASATDAAPPDAAADASPPDVDAGPPPSCLEPEPVWAFGAGDDAAQRVNDIAMDAAGNTYVVGYFGGTLASFGDPPFLESTSAHDVFVAKLSPSGEVIWRRGFGGSGWASLSALAIDGNGDLIIGGAFAGSFVLDGFSFAPNPSEDAFVARLDAGDGDVLDAVRIGGAQRKFVLDLVVDAESPVPSIVAVGVFDDCTFGGSTTPCPASSYDDLFIARLDQDLVVRRNTSFGSSGYQQARGVALDAGRRLIVAGNFEGTLAFGAPAATLTSTTSGDAFVAAFDLPADLTAAFAPVWAVAYGPGGCASPPARRANDVALGPPSGGRADVYVVGEFSGCIAIDGVRDDAVGMSDGFVARLDGDDGATLGKLVLAGTSAQSLTSIVRDRDGAFLVGGSTMGTLSLGGATVTVTAARQDLLLFRLVPPTTVDWVRHYGAPSSFAQNTRVAMPPEESGIDAAFAVSAVYLNQVIFDPDASPPLVASSGAGADVLVARFACEP